MSLKLDWRSLQIGKSVGPEFETPIYFFDPSAADSLTIVDPEAATKLIVGWKNSATGSNALLPLELEQNTSNDQPVWDGVKKITFADTSDFMALEPPITQGGWLIVGTSVGTFTYRIKANALTNVNLLGRVAHTSTPGDLYGMMLIPATSDQFVIDQTRQRFINAGAADGVVGTSLQAYWSERNDILEFGFVDTSEVTNFRDSWHNCTGLTSFPLLDVSSGTNFLQSWRGCNSLTSFPLLDVSSGTIFSFSWRFCSSLTSFPLLDVSSGTNFLQSWQDCNSLTSFPVLNVSSGTNFLDSWRSCTSLTSFPLLDVSSGTTFRSSWNSCTSLTSFPLLDVSKGTIFQTSWFNCNSLTSFPLLDVSKGTNFANCWRFCTSLTSFPLLDVSSGTDFVQSWQDCTSLSSFPPNFFDGCAATNFTNAFLNTNLSQTSIDGILVSINSNETTDGNFRQSGGSAPSTAGEDAIDALRARGWTVTVTGGY